MGSAAAASSAAILGPAASASLDQPAVSRILAYLMSAPTACATSENSGASWVQPTISGSPPAAAARNFSSSARQSWRAVVTLAPRQPRCTAAPSSGIVSSHEQIRIFGGRSGISSPKSIWSGGISSYNHYKQPSRAWNLKVWNLKAWNLEVWNLEVLEFKCRWRTAHACARR